MATSHLACVLTSGIAGTYLAGQLTAVSDPKVGQVVIRAAR